MMRSRPFRLALSSFMVARQGGTGSLSARPEAEAVALELVMALTNLALKKASETHRELTHPAHAGSRNSKYRAAKNQGIDHTTATSCPVEVAAGRRNGDKRQAPLAAERPWESHRQGPTSRLYRYLYRPFRRPLLWVHLSTDYPYNLQGNSLFFQKLTRFRGDWEKVRIRLYCNQVFVTIRSRKCAATCCPCAA